MASPAAPAPARMDQKSTNTMTECYELRRRQRTDPEPRLSLGIGFPEDHPLRTRAFTMPVSVPAAVSPRKADPSLGVQQQVHRRCEWWSPSPSPSPSGSESKSGSGSPQTGAAGSDSKQRNKVPKQVWVDTMNVCAPSSVRLVSRLRPTFLEVSPSPIEFLSGASADCHDPDDVLAGDQVQISGDTTVRNRHSLQRVIC